MNLKKFFLLVSIAGFYISSFSAPVNRELEKYPAIELSNKIVKLKVYTPDKEKGFYRGTRFDWGGMIASLQFKGHEYFGEWRLERNPLAPSDVTGPVDGYLTAGLGYDEAKTGGEFIRIGIGVLEKPEEKDFQMFKTYKFIDYGKWTTTNGKDWIEFRHEVSRLSGWGYVYTKRIDLLKNEPGFRMSYSLKNTGDKTIETDQFNHNFFMIDGVKTGSSVSLRFPFEIKPDDNPRNRPNPQVNYVGKEVVFSDTTLNRDVWVSLTGYSKEPKDNAFEIINKKSGAGVNVQGDMPLYQLNFWATKNTLCPETFIYLKVGPGAEEKWNSVYKLFIK